MTQSLKAMLALAGMASLAGCISFGAKPPPSLLTLDAASSVPIGTEQNSAVAKSIVIDVPVVPQSLATARIPVQVTPTSIAYVPDALWTEPPARLFARLLADTVTARSGLVVVSSVQAIGDPGAQLSGELRRFGIDTATRAAIVTFDAALRRSGAAGVEKRRFEASVPVATIDAASSGVALSGAANQVAAQVTDWVGR